MFGSNHIKKISFIIFLSVFWTCGTTDDKSYFNGEITVIDQFNEKILLQGQEILLDSINTGYMSVCDSLLLFASSGYTDNYLYVFSLNSGKLLTKLCPKGRGAGEYISFTHTEQYIKDSNDIKLWVSDGIRSHIFLNLTASIRNGKEQHDSILRLDGNKISKHGFSLIFILNDHKILTRIQCEKLFYNDQTYIPEKYILYEGNEDHEIRTFSQFKKPILNLNEIDPTTFYNLYSRIKPDNNKLVTAMRHLAQINILNIQNGKWEGFRIKGTPDIHSLTGDIRNFHIYYTDVCTDNQYIYALYLNKPIYEEDRSSRIIHVFNWKGMPLYEITLSEPVQQIAVDSYSHHIYGKNGLEQVFCYKRPSPDN